MLPEAKKFRKGSKNFIFVEVSRCRYLDRRSIEPSPNIPLLDAVLGYTYSKFIRSYPTVRYHCGGWPEEVNSCFLNSYMVYL